jgi:hypothetical protein
MISPVEQITHAVNTCASAFSHSVTVPDMHDAMLLVMHDWLYEHVGECDHTWSFADFHTYCFKNPHDAMQFSLIWA